MSQAKQRRLQSANGHAPPAEQPGMTRRLPEKLTARLERLRQSVVDWEREAQRETQRRRTLFLECLTGGLIGMSVDIDAYQIEPTPDLKAVVMVPLATPGTAAPDPEPPAPDEAPTAPAGAGAESS